MADDAGANSDDAILFQNPFYVQAKSSRIVTMRVPDTEVRDFEHASVVVKKAINLLLGCYQDDVCTPSQVGVGVVSCTTPVGVITEC